MNTELIENRQIRIFISSTFQDMEAERNYLMKHVFPQLRAKAAKRNVSLVELDLRWGITEEEAKTGKVIEICLNEIENSQPFFIGLLGDRYGWQPTADEILKNTNLTERYPWIIDDVKSGLSVTEIEMQYGVLRNEANLNASFYIKDSAVLVVSEEDEKAQKKLEQLKRSVKENSRYPYYTYSTPEDIGEQITKDFEELLDKYFPKKEMTQLERERNAQRSVCNNLCTSYIAVEENFKVLNEFLSSADPYFCVVAESGLGKSALMANWVKRLEEKADQEIIYHFVGNSDSGNNYETILKRFADEICERFSIELTEEAKKKEPIDLISEVIFKIPAVRKVVLILDAVNQINEADYAKQLAWLPTLPANVKLVLSTLPDDDTFAAITRRNIPTFTLKPLQLADRIKMIVGYLKRYGKALTTAQINRIVNDSQNENTLVLKTLLNQLIVFGKHEELDACINYYLEAETIPDFFQKVLQRAEEDYGIDLVRHALSLIAVSRNGMAEKELTDIIGCQPLYWSQMYCAFIMHFNVKNGLVNFAHSYIRQAVINRYLNDESQIKALRYEITSYLKEDETPRALDELPFQYYLMNDNEMLYKFVMDIVNFVELYIKDLYELSKYWQKLKKVNLYDYSPRGYIEQIEKNKFDEDDKAFFYLCLSTFFANIFIDVELSLQCAEKALNIQLQHVGKMDSYTATCYYNFGNRYSSMGQYEKALEYNEKALNIQLQLFGEMNEDTARSYNSMGNTYYSMGQYDKALEYQKKAQNIQLSLFGEMNEDTARSYNNISCIYCSMGQYDKGLEYLEKALNIQLQLFGEMNKDTATSYNNIGHTYSSMGQYDKGLEYLEKALNIQLQLFGEMNKDTATCYNNIGKIYSSMGQYDKALEYLEKVLKIQLQLFGDMNPDTARSYNNIGHTYSSMGQYDKGLEYLEKALKIQLQLFGEMNPYTATNYSNIGDTYDSMGQYDKALGYYDKALKIQLQLFGEMNPDTARSYNNMGHTYHSKGQYDKGLEYYEKALKIRLQLFGEMNEDTARSYNNTGCIYDSMGQYDKALEYSEKAYNIRLQLLGENDKDTLFSYGETTMCHYALNNFFEFSRRLEHLIDLQGDKTDISMFYFLANSKLKIGKYEEAISLFEKCNGKFDDETNARIHLLWGNCLFEVKRYKEALELHSESWEERKELLGEDCEATMVSYEWKGRDYVMLNELDKAMPILNKALDYNKGTEWEFLPIQYLAIAYGKQGDKEKAMALFKEGYKHLADCGESKYTQKGKYLYWYARQLNESGDSVPALELAEEGLKYLKLHYKEHEHPYIDRQVKLIDDIKTHPLVVEKVEVTAVEEVSSPIVEKGTLRKCLDWISHLFKY